jgi:Fe-S cluster assembly protein SufD
MTNIISQVESVFNAQGSNEPIDPIRGAIRDEAFTHVKTLGIPNRKLEAWKYTPVDRILDRGYVIPLIAVGDLTDEQLDKHLIPDLDAHFIVTLNGRIDQLKSNIGQLPPGVIISSLEHALSNHSDLVARHFGKYARSEHDAFVAMNAAISKSGLFIYVPSGTDVAQPIHIVHLSDAVDPTMTQTRSLVVMDEGSRATIVETQSDTGRGLTFANNVLECALDRHAFLDHYVLQRFTPKGSVVNTLHAHQEESSVFDTHTITLSGATIRNQPTIHPDAEHCTSHMYGVVMGSGEMHVDNHTLVDHAKPNCDSNELYKTILSGRSTGIFNGKVFVRRDAQQTNAYQSNKSVVLSDDAKMYSKPELEIYADDVKCSHGATTGKLDAEAMFYLQARGLSKPEAQRLLLIAFVGDVIEAIRLPSVQSYVADRISELIQ